MADVRDNDGPSYDDMLAETLAEFYADPLGYVLFAFPWDSDPSIQLVKFPEEFRGRYPSAPEYGPDLWACEFLDYVAEQVKIRKFDGRHAVDPIRIATASGHGIGKSVLTAWLIKWIMDTRPFARGVVTANTAEQLRTKTWAELGKWHRISITEQWFDYSSGRGSMSFTSKDYKESWRCDAQTSREENSESFAGLHAANSTPFYIFDEASGIPDKIFEVREGGTTDGEPMVFDFGNPTRNSGRFYEQCVGRLKHLWKQFCIDSRYVAITNKKRLQEWIDTYGEDSDFVKVRVRGVFPAAGSAQFIASGDVELAMTREFSQQEYVANQWSNALVMGVDVARFGEDDSVIFIRQGDDARTWAPRRYKGLSTDKLVDKVIEVTREFKQLGQEFGAIFIDGTGVGGGVVDLLRRYKYDVTEVQFGSKPSDANMYRYTSDEIWGKMRDHIAGRLRLPREFDDSGSQLREELTSREFGYTVGKLQIHLETKRDMKDRGVPSPDIADALALTYYRDVAPRRHHAMPEPTQTAQSDYDPFA